MTGFLDHDLRSGIDYVAVEQVAAYGFAGAIADADVQMRAADRYGAHKAYDLEMPAALVAMGLVGKANMIMGKAAHPATDPAGTDMVRSWLLKIL